MRPPQLQGIHIARKPKKPRTLLASQLEYIKQVSRHTPGAIEILRKSFAGVSKAAAIKARCWECTNWQRAEVTRCHIDTCPLWPYRPFASGARAAKANAETEQAEPAKTDA